MALILDTWYLLAKCAKSRNEFVNLNYFLLFRYHYDRADFNNLICRWLLLVHSREHNNSLVKG